MCPQRCRALRELRIRDGPIQPGEADDASSAAQAIPVRSNVLDFAADRSAATLYFNDHKTSASNQPMVLRVSNSGNSSETALFRVMKAYVETFRHFLVLPGNDDQGRVFLTSRGRGFSEAEFSHWIASSFERKTGVRMSFNLLRSSFVTSMLSHSQAGGDAAVREGVAACMGSSETYQRQSYDRRRRQDIRKRGLEFAHAVRVQYEAEEGSSVD